MNPITAFLLGSRRLGTMVATVFQPVKKYVTRTPTTKLHRSGDHWKVVGIDLANGESWTANAKKIRIFYGTKFGQQLVEFFYYDPTKPIHKQYAPWMLRLSPEELEKVEKWMATVTEEKDNYLTDPKSDLWLSFIKPTEGK